MESKDVKSWRDVIRVHPAADLFPMMSEPELRELAEDIKRNELRNRVVLMPDQDGYVLLDGRNRLAAMEMAGLDVSNGLYGNMYLTTLVPQTTDPYSYVISANIHRRHLTQEQKRELVAKLLKATPEKSDRQIAATSGVDHKTVGAVRKEREARGDIPRVATITDTKGRQQPVDRNARPQIDPSPSQQRQSDPPAPPNDADPAPSKPPFSPLKLVSGPITPIEQGAMHLRQFVFELARAIPAESWPALFAELHDELTDIAEILKKEQADE